MMHVNIIMLHFEINKWHVNIIKLIKCWLKSRMYGGQKYATVEFLSCTVSAWGGGVYKYRSVRVYECIFEMLIWKRMINGINEKIDRKHLTFTHSVHKYLPDIWVLEFWIRQTLHVYPVLIHVYIQYTLRLFHTFLFSSV